MSALQNCLTKPEVLELLPPLSRTATAATPTGVDCQKFEGVAIVLLTTTAGGSGATLDAKVQESDDNSTYTDVTGAVFTQVGNAASLQLLRIDMSKAKRYLRVPTTVGGTAAFVSAVELIGINKYIGATG